jgi:hypothetical protein
MFLNDMLSQWMVQDLMREVRNYQRRVPNDLTRLKEVLRPGDVILVEGNTHLSQIIMYLTQSSWSHSAMYIGDALLRWGGPEADRALESFGEDAAHLLMESDLDSGVAVAPLTK